MKVRLSFLNLLAISTSFVVLTLPALAQTPETPKIEPVVVVPAPGSAKADSKAVTAEAAADDEILPYYDNYLREYRLGPSDVISVEVFGQCPDYCKTAISIPPNARISYPLIREGIMVAGKTVEQIAAEITKK